MKRGNLYLSGFMAAGKSTVGPLVASRLDAPLRDTDALVTAKAGKPIAEIFARDGEAAFRALETAVLAGIAFSSGQVVSLGGGAVLSATNRAILRRGLWIHLDVPFALLKRRLANCPERPLANLGDEALRDLWRSRAPLYREAHVIVRCADFSADFVSQKVLDAVAGCGLRCPS